MSSELHADVQRYLTAQYPAATISDFSYLSGGWECDIYAFTLTVPDSGPRDFILRLYLANDGVEKTIREGGGLSKLYQVGYPVPEILAFETNSAILGKPFIIMEKLDGQSLWAKLSSVDEQRENQLLDQFGQLLAQLHHLDWHLFTEHPARYQANPGAVIDDLLSPFRRLYRQYEVEGLLAVVNWLDTHKSLITVQPSVVHLDFHANNVFLRDDSRMTIIDWSQLAVSDYRCDLAWTLMIMGDHGQPEWREKILNAYTHAIGHPVEHLDYFNIMGYTKLLGSAVISLRFGAEALGMRPETIETTRQQGDWLRRVYQRVQAITDLSVPEIQSALDQID
jgi:aminoglycoside phosphotransferase (APT) family kinase protein